MSEPYDPWIYALSGADTEEEFYEGPWWERNTFTQRIEVATMLRPEAIPNPDYHGEPWVAPYTGYRNVTVTKEDTAEPSAAV